MSTEQCLDDAVDLHKYVKVIKKRKKMILITFLICLITTAVVTFRMPKTYEVSAIVRIGSFGDLLISKQDAQYAIESQSVLNGAIKKFKLDITSDELSELIVTNDIVSTDLMYILVRYDSPEIAFNLSKYIADSFITLGQTIYKKKYEFISEAIKKEEGRLSGISNYQKKLNEGILGKEYELDFPLIQNTLFSYESITNDINERIYDQKIVLMNAKEFELFETPLLPKSAVKPNIKLNLVLAAILGLMLGVFGAFLKEFFMEK
ncbi:MAG: Wzz/FepE/Etk N-terminal domain-containing protein [Candidatus Omnitrophota bacterium]